MRKRNISKKRFGYLMATMLIALTITATSTYAWFDFNLLTGATATLLIVIFALIAAAVIYAKFFRGSATKLFNKLRKN